MTKEERTKINNTLKVKIHRWNAELEKNRQETESKLDEIVKAYASMPSGQEYLTTLENMKRSLVGYLQYYTSFMAIARSHFEGTNYLESSRKWLKSYCISQLVQNEEGLSSASAERIVYDSDLYTIGMEIIDSMKTIFLTIDYKFNRYKAVERDIQQTISVITKELEIR